MGRKVGTVQPIREKDLICRFKNELAKNGTRDVLMFKVGINTGLRISDILSLKVEDVKDRTHISIIEKKTGKTKRFFVNEGLRQDIKNFTEGMADNEYLFQSQKGNNKPISRVQAYRILNQVADKLGIEEVGTHTLRKTFGYWHYQKNKDVAVLQEIFNHSSPSITLRYIGINGDMIDKSLEGFYL